MAVVKRGTVVEVSDETSEPVVFTGLTLEDSDDAEGTEVDVATFVTGESGFGWSSGETVIETLKLLGDGKYGAA